MLPPAPPAALLQPRRMLAALLLLALAACAGAPATGPVAIGPADGSDPGKPPAALRHAADIPGPACAPEHRALIEEALGVARTRTAEAARLAQAEPGHPHLRRWFGDAPAPEVADRLRRTAEQLGQPETFKLLCNDPPSCRGTRVAYASAVRRIVGVCPGFFRAAMEGYDSRWGMLVHEASHLAAGTQDHAYGPTAALILAKDDPSRAAVNADSYEYFVETLPR